MATPAQPGDTISSAVGISHVPASLAVGVIAQLAVAFGAAVDVEAMTHISNAAFAQYAHDVGAGGSQEATSSHAGGLRLGCAQQCPCGWCAAILARARRRWRLRWQRIARDGRRRRQ